MYWGPTNSIIEGDFTVDSTTLYPGGTTYNMTVSGTMALATGADPYDAIMGATNTAGTYEFGSLFVGSGAIMYGSAGEITITDEGARGGSDYCTYIEEGGTFTHNSGTVTIEGAKADSFTEMVWKSNPLYNLNVWLTAPCNQLLISNNEDATGLVVANDLNVIAAKTFKTFGTGNSKPLTVSGTATISGTLGVATETSSAWTFVPSILNLVVHI